MSELTRCNYCTLNNIKARYGVSNVEIRLSQSGDLRGWTEVYVRGKRVASFMAVTDHCVC
jgi:hypothetical protein